MGDHEAQPETARNPWWALHVDALTRAWRTLYTGFILDALVLIGGGISNLLSAHEVTTEAFWIALLILVTKSFLTALGSYLLRLKVTPKNIQKEGQPA
ncbi:hypothetical protein [Arthrobacter sp. Soil762]|uniref:hypothetical protein n=1 Tax=Arthrobacter sp. Soil762 TaxID=1736401 RepID=UPI0006F90C3F|nr:hypothetical protein [Arthrobacter sp. Soil762]KRE72574.1 hypothetical protein ASG77_07850 [Arthrobacter sp. Soil762]